MNKIVILFLVVFNISNAQIKDSLGFNYRSYKYWSVMDNCNGWYNDIVFNTEAKNIHCLNIANKNKLDYFLNNLDDFTHIKALSIYKVRVKDFDFLSKLPNLQYISVGVINRNNVESFVRNLNNNQKIETLDISQLKMNRFPKGLNKLKHIKSMELRNSKMLKYVEIDLPLKQLSFVNNRRLKYIYTQNVNYISFASNNLKELPKGLNESINLMGLKFTSENRFTIDCPIEGFEKLKILDFFGMPAGTYLNNIDDDCFKNKENISIHYPSDSWKAPIIKE